MKAKTFAVEIPILTFQCRTESFFKMLPLSSEKLMIREKKNLVISSTKNATDFLETVSLLHVLDHLSR